MISLGAKELGASLGIILTASHNPPTYNGYKLKGNYGGPLLAEDVQAVQDLIPDSHSKDLDAIKLSDLETQGLLEHVDLDQMYLDKVEVAFDLDLIKKSELTLAYDAMYGAGQKIVKRILPEAAFFRCEHDPSFKGVAPEPIMKNLLPYAEFIKQRGDIDLGLATDGDADRIGLMDGNGNFVDSHHTILMLVHYFKHYKGLDGRVCTAASSTVKIQDMAKHYNLPLDIVKIGFKWICGIMVEQGDVIVGGEESGGIAVAGHIPERDGVWIGLTMLEFMAKTGKSINELIQEVYDIVGTFAFERNDLHLEQAHKDKIVAMCENNEITQIGNRKIIKTDTIDGFKYFFNEKEWLMIRPSGTEPVLRTYAESDNQENALAILKDCLAMINSNKKTAVTA
jgi:phosphomannomutase